MADSASAPKVKKVSKPKKAASHPKYSDMIRSAISSLKERTGSSRQATLRYIMAHYDVGKDEKVVNTHLKMALKAGVRKGALKQSKGSGASGSFKLNAAEKPKKKSPSKKAQKPKAARAKKVKSPAKKGAKKPAAKKVAKKKPAAKKSPAKKPAAKKVKSPKKKAAAKPKAKKSAKKSAKK